jgi:minor histocompatibility antigen H13
MLSVATSDAISGPTRLLFPRPPGSTGEASSFPFSLLGLGDVAVPGLLACLALRYDATRAVDLRVRGAAAAAALAAAIDGAPPGATGRQLAEAAGAAAEAAYDGVAEREAAARAGTEGGGGGGAGPAWVATDAVMEQRTYFGPVMAAYIAGLLAAFAANSATGLGQPALLYLCPLTLGAVAAMAAARGELGRIWAFRDSAPRALTLGGGGAAEDA